MLIDPSILIALAALVVVMPPTFDGMIEDRVKNPSLLAFLVLLVGVVCGSLGGALSQLAQGATWRSAATVFVAGTLSGLASGWKNYASAARAAKMADGVAKAGAMVLVLFVASGLLEGCIGPGNPAAIPGDVVQLDVALCKLEKDMGGPTITLLCPTSSSASAGVKVTMPRSQFLALSEGR